MSSDSSSNSNVLFARSYLTIVRRAAVLSPLCGSSKSSSAILRNAKRLSKWWRARICTLHGGGWAMTQQDHARVRRTSNPNATARSCKTRMFRCPSAFMTTAKTLNPCKVRGICPHCWARNASAQWLGVDVRLFGPVAHNQLGEAHVDGAASVPGLALNQDELKPSRRPSTLHGYAMIERRLIVPLLFEEDPRTRDLAFLKQFLHNRCNRNRVNNKGARIRHNENSVPSRRNDQTLFTKLGIVGGIDVLSLDLAWSPKLTTEEAQDHLRMPIGWKVVIRQLLFVPADRVESVRANGIFRDGPLVTRPFGAPRIVVTEEPTRRQIAHAVARLYRYPVSLLRGPVNLTLMILAAREGLRLTATFGILHGRIPAAPLALRGQTQDKARGANQRHDRT